MPRKFGALPPPGMEWQIGKTVASIRFVNGTEVFLETCQDTDKAELLREAILKVKNGELVLYDWLTPEEYLDQHAP